MVNDDKRWQHLPSKCTCRIDWLIDYRRFRTAWLALKVHERLTSPSLITIYLPTVCRTCKTRLNWAVLHMRHSRCGTIKVPPWLKALNAEHRPKFCSPLPAMVTLHTVSIHQTLGKFRRNWSDLGLTLDILKVCILEFKCFRCCF
jgi:hypothetical protein